MSKSVMILGAILSLVFFGGCGSGSATGGSDSGTGSSGTVAEINSISDVPLEVVDPSAYDLSTTSASRGSLSAPLALTTKKAATFSRAGCEIDRMKRNIVRNALLPKMILCHMQAFEEAAGGNAAGDGVFNLWKGNDEMSEDSGPPGVDTFKPRMAIKKSGTTLTFVMCNDTTQAMELVIDTAGNQYSGHVIDKWGDGFQGRLTFLSDGPPDNFTTASFTQEMVEESSFWNGFGSETLEATPDHNTVHGFYNESGEDNYAGSVYGRYTFNSVAGTGQGTARFLQETAGSYEPMTLQAIFDNCEIQSGTGQCGDFTTDWIGAGGWLDTECSLSGWTAATQACFPNDCVEGETCCPYEATMGEDCISPAGEDHRESFTITLLDAATNTLGFNVATTSDFDAFVTAAVMPDSSTAPTIEFTTASSGVDCSGSASWTLLTFTTAPDISACQAIEAELNNWDTGELCQILDANAAAGAAGSAQ